jgi:hypothetical protein
MLASIWRQYVPPKYWYLPTNPHPKDQHHLHCHDGGDRSSCKMTAYEEQKITNQEGMNLNILSESTSLKLVLVT